MKMLWVKPNSWTMVDDEDHERFKHRSWWLTGYGYASARTSNGNIYLHKAIWDAPSNIEVDHINNDKLDNRRDNLRFATRTQNLMNRRRKENAKSPYKGVYKHSQNGNWCAQLNHQHLGSFPTAKISAIIYNKHAQALYGEYAKLNHIQLGINSNQN